jgi:hypothetical protein
VRAGFVVEVQSSLRGSLLLFVSALIAASASSLNRLHGFAPVEAGMIDVQRSFKIVHVISKGDPLPQQAGVVDSGHR